MSYNYSVWILRSDMTDVDHFEGSFAIAALRKLPSGQSNIRIEFLNETEIRLLYIIIIARASKYFLRTAFSWHYNQLCSLIPLIILTATTMAPTQPPTTSPTTNEQTTSSSGTTSTQAGCTGGCIAGVVVGFLFVFVLLVVIVVIVLCYWSKTRSKWFFLNYVVWNFAIT